MLGQWQVHIRPTPASHTFWAIAVYSYTSSLKHFIVYLCFDSFLSYNPRVGLDTRVCTDMPHCMSIQLSNPA